MKLSFLIIAGVLLLLNVVGCGRRDMSKTLEQYKYEVSTIDSTLIHKKKLEPWIKEGIACYGIAIVYNLSGAPIRIKEFSSRIISIEPDKIKMRSLENISLAPVKGCSKFSLEKGEDWEEPDGELFKTREEAIAFIDARYPGLRVK
jgi:hypothetical protein